MRRATVLAVLLCAAQAGPGGGEPTCRCVLAEKPAALKTVAETGLPELDKRLKSEANFLKQLFGVEAEVLLLAGGAPRPVFAAGSTVALAAEWLKPRWQSENRTATVAYALAHQWAHVLQAQRGLKLGELSRELHADLLAGWFLGRRNFATLGSGTDLDPTFAASLFAEADEFLNERFEHGRPADRAEAVATGFRLFRKDKLSLDKIYAKGLELYPPPKVGMADDVAGPPEGPYKTIKLECTHKGPCHHQVACQHPQPCTHKVACRHEVPCVHQIPCVHKVACQHQIPCVHRVKCKHKVPCVHSIPCTHREHSCDYLHPYDYDANGTHVDCVHRVPCVHFRHRCDYLHNFDYEHEWDFQHEYDTQHKYDMAHEFDTMHKSDPEHEFDLAHDWDPVHPFDLAHEWDPAHAYDVRYVPVAEAEGAAGAK